MTISSGYSAKVALTLLVDGVQLALSRVGPAGIVVRDECQPIAPCDATILIQVDQAEEALKVYLPDGVPGPQQRIRFF
jgi:hypothetical protein